MEVLLSEDLLLTGPEPEEYCLINDFFHRYNSDTADVFKTRFADLRNEVAAFRKENSIVGFCYLKPHGYAGDYEMIDRLYTQYISDDISIKKWDVFAQAQPAAKAVRNRKQYFAKLLEKQPATTDVLNVASGPGRDLKDFFDKYPNTSVRIDCIDQDADAIAYAQRLLSHHPNVQFHQCNILRWQGSKLYDLVWSAGLFDYFSDKVFIAVLTKLLNQVKPGGELVIGNFSDTNPNRAFMEVAMDWHLHHRSEEQLIDLALQAGALSEHIAIGKEDEQVNLFLHIKKPL